MTIQTRSDRRNDSELPLMAFPVPVVSWTVGRLALILL